MVNESAHPNLLPRAQSWVTMEMAMTVVEPVFLWPCRITHVVHRDRSLQSATPL
jgi:hypothetical protein